MNPALGSAGRWPASRPRWQVNHHLVVPAAGRHRAPDGR
ncbi:Hypothetical protein EPM1_0268 [Stenotrophomonas maltophilia EPM1]|nr:Hypothetical protein EPM1_0268 [Stenotrophomonas maltophilia EPM1]